MEARCRLGRWLLLLPAPQTPGWSSAAAAFSSCFCAAEEGRVRERDGDNDVRASCGEGAMGRRVQEDERTCTSPTVALCTVRCAFLILERMDFAILLLLTK